MMKVSIPKEEIDRIVKQYKCSETQAAKAYLDAKDASRETFEEVLDRQLGEKSGKEEWKVPILSPRQIKAHLDKYVIGQEEYKKRLSIAAAFHFAILRKLEEDPEKTGVKRFRKKNTIIAGPSGSGKTYCVEVLGDLLEVPTLIVDATDYTEAGYVGKSADDMIREIIDMAPGSTRRDKADFVNRYGGIIFIDEVDKKAKDGKVIGHDISREGFQRAVLKLIERKFVSIDNPLSPSSQIQEIIDRQRGRESKKKENSISTEKILFILGGSFQRKHDDLEIIVKDRIKHQTGHVRENGSVVVRGFGTDEAGERDDSMRNYYKEADADDYIQFGLLPELVGRTPIRTYVNLLSKNDLVRIMKDTEDSIIHQYKVEFKAFDIDLIIEDAAIECVAIQAENKKTGARALVSVWENILTEFQFELPGSNFKELIITEELCNAPKDALLKMLKRSPFVDFVEGFRKEYGIELDIEQKAQEYIIQYADENHIQLSESLERLLKRAPSLNYMNIKGKYIVTHKMLEDEKFFDKLFTQWYQKMKKKLKKEENRD